MTEIRFGKDAEDIGKLISREMPAVAFVSWDLTPFMPYFHDWRKNMVFVECDKAAVDALTERLATEYPNYDIYAGERKPALKINRGKMTASIVITAREGINRREVSGNKPKIEKCLVDLLYYSKNDILPIPIKDVLGLWKLYLYPNDSNDAKIRVDIKFSELYRYSQRRYLSWLVSIFAYEMVQRGGKHSNVNTLSGRHLAQGKKILEIVRMVQKFE